jgi:hypothetical protein
MWASARGTNEATDQAAVLLGDGIRYLALVNAASAWSGGTRRWRASKRMS